MNRRIANVGYAALVTFGCTVAVWAGILKFRPPTEDRGEIALETKLEQPPRKRRMISIVGKKYISLAELNAETVRRMGESSKSGERDD